MPTLEYPHSGTGSPYRDRKDPFQDPFPTTRPGESKQSPRRPTTGNRTQNPQASMMEALQDVVTVKAPYRAKPTRSSTAIGTITPPTSSSRPRQPQRTMTADSTDKTGRTTPPPPSKPAKKKSTHVDLIDQLDYSGLGGGTFHHDGPFDALAPSRNRNGQKAPMSAFNDADQLDDPTAPDPTQLHRRKNSDSPYAIATTYIGTKGVNRHSEPLKSPVKSALAEAWGRADPEPFEEFSAGGYSAAPSTYAESVESEDGAPNRRSRAREEVAARNARRNTRIAPPPQPIILPGSVADNGFEPPSASPPLSPVTAKRNRSIMNRFRRGRADSSSLPAPLPDLDDIASSPESQNGIPWDGQLPSPNTPDEYVIIDNGRPITVVYSKDRPAGAIDYRSRPPLTQKALPDPPADDYFPESTTSEGGRVGSPGIRLGRKTSLYRKVKGLGARVASR